jgi:hypothetical protein
MQEEDQMADRERDSQVPVGSEDIDNYGDAHEGEEVEESARGLRGKLQEAHAKIRELEEANVVKTDAIRGQELDVAFAANGLSRTEGIGKAIAIAYDGEPTATALAEHLVTEYQYEFFGAPNPLANEIALAYEQLDQIGQTAGSVPHVTPWDEELAKAEATGDTDKTLAMKSQQVAGWFRQ